MRPSKTRPLAALAIVTLLAGACSDAATGPADRAERGSPPTTGSGATPVAGPAAEVTVDLPGLTGGGFVTEYYVRATYETLHEMWTSFLASTGPMVETSPGVCCRVLGDTALQVNFKGVPVVGANPMKARSIELPDEPYSFGSADVLVIIRETDRRMRYYVMTEPADLVVTDYVAPVGSQPGRLRASITFEAAGYIREHSRHFSTATVTPLPEKFIVRAQIDTPMRYQVRDITIPRQ